MVHLQPFASFDARDRLDRLAVHYDYSVTQLIGNWRRAPSASSRRSCPAWLDRTLPLGFPKPLFTTFNKAKHRGTGGANDNCRHQRFAQEALESPFSAAGVLISKVRTRRLGLARNPASR
jgi:hypothetical protein